MKNLIYFHIATIGDYQNIFDEIYSQIIHSKLIEKVESLNLCIVGDGDLKLNQDKKINIFKTSDILENEFFTLNYIKSFSEKCNQNLKILYLHTKGVTTPNNQCIVDWRKYMTYFNVVLHEECLRCLDNYDACGVDLVSDPHIHFSGNFWWANSNYIKKLPSIHDIKYNIRPVLSVRHNCEFWIGMGDGKLKSLWNSNINIYERHLHRYSNSEYIKCL